MGRLFTPSVEGEGCQLLLLPKARQLPGNNTRTSNQAKNLPACHARTILKGCLYLRKTPCVVSPLTRMQRPPAALYSAVIKHSFTVFHRGRCLIASASSRTYKHAVFVKTRGGGGQAYIVNIDEAGPKPFTFRHQYKRTLNLGLGFGKGY